ncbi:nuclear protein SET [Paraburkholderia hospita]|uniref:Nuclear protein SET n=1 Tax=Paraburkholderia hospita TaxID=169430 RepID=A0ABP2P8R5_9BURK|nr:nuclear protein SET [Paraburkholderia hospita]
MARDFFELQPIAPGEWLIEYKGEVTSWRRAAARQRSEAGLMALTAFTTAPE